MCVQVRRHGKVTTYRPVCTCVCLFQCPQIQATWRCQCLGECTDLAQCHVFWEREHLAGITMFCLALRIALWAVAAITMPRTGDLSLGSLNALMEDTIQVGVKYLPHELKRFAAWTVASFYNNFHLKLAQYIFNEFYKTFNNPQFISSGKWLSSLKWWAGYWLYIHYLRRKSDFLKNALFSLCLHPDDVKALMSAGPLSLKDAIL